MKKWFGKILSRFHQPRWRHGKLGALLMACFLLACVLINIGVKALEDEYGWKRDLSFNGYATTGEETQKALDRLEHDVELYLLYQSGEVDAYVQNLLERYAVLSDRIRVLPTDLARNPGILTRFQGDLDRAIEADTVALENVRAPRVSGRVVAIGEDCEIELVQYSEQIEISPRAKVGRTEKL